MLLSIFYFGNHGQWILNYKSEFTCDSYGNRTQSHDYHWDVLTSEWKEGENTDNDYDSYGNKNQSIVSYKSDIRRKTNWYYSDVETSITSSILSTKVKSFPNPATGYITFDIEDDSQPASVELINMQGEKVISQILTQSRQIEVSQLKSGMYFYRIQQDDKIFKGKVIVK